MMDACGEDFGAAEAENIACISNVEDSFDDGTLESFYDQLPHVSDPNASYSSFIQSSSKDVSLGVHKAVVSNSHRRSTSGVGRPSTASGSQRGNNRSSSISGGASVLSSKSKLNDSKNVTFRRKSSMPKLKNGKSKQQQQQQQQYAHPVIPEHERLLRRYFNGVLHQVKDQVAMADASPDVTEYYENVKKWALAMYTQDQLFTATAQTLRELVQTERLSVRAEADISADVGLQETVSQLLLHYHPNWLRLGLEVVLDKEIPTVLNRHTFRKVLDNYVFSNVQLREHYAGECLVPSGENEKKMKSEMWAHCLSTLLVLVHFLDTLALSGQVPMWRCLFVANPSPAQHSNVPVTAIKASKTIVQQLGSLVVSGRGDLPVYLNKHQIFVQYEQKPADEIDYTIRNFMRDMPDGLRFAQAIDLMSSSSSKLLYSLHAQDDLSAIKRKANLEKVIARMQADGLNMSSLDAAKISSGDSSQVVRLAWMVAYHYGTSWMINPVRVYKQIFHIQQAPVVVQPPQGSALVRRKAAIDQALLMWAMAIAAKSNMQIKQLSSAFSDGLLFCRIIHMYDPWLIDEELLRASPGQGARGKQRFQNSAKTVDPIGARQRALVKACRAIGCIIEPPCDPKKAPSSQDVTMFLCALFDCVLHHTRQLRAALVLQTFYRNIVQPIVAAKKPKRRPKNLALPRRGSSMDSEWLSSNREPTIELFYLERPNSAAVSEISEIAQNDHQNTTENEADEDVDIPLLDVSGIAQGELGGTDDEAEDAENMHEDMHETSDNDVDIGLLDASGVLPVEVHEDESAQGNDEDVDIPLLDASGIAQGELDESEAEEDAQEDTTHEDDVQDVGEEGDAHASVLEASQPEQHSHREASLEEAHAPECAQAEAAFLTVTSCREVIRRARDGSNDPMAADEYEVQSILHDLQQPDLSVTDAILAMRRFGEIACTGPDACAMIAAQPNYFDTLIRIICSRQRTSADIDIICHCLVVVTQVAAVAQDLSKTRARKLVDIVGDLLLSYYHFEAIVQCCMGTLMRLFADCLKFMRVCTKPKIVTSFQQIAQAWDLREEALVIAESALGYPLPRVPTTIDVYKPTTPSLRAFVDGIEPGVSTVQLFCAVIANPTGHVHLMVEEQVVEAEDAVNQHAEPVQPTDDEPQEPESPTTVGPTRGIMLTPDANRSHGSNLYLSPSPTLAEMIPRSTGTKSFRMCEPAQSLSQYCSSPSSDISEDVEGGWQPGQMQGGDDTSCLFESNDLRIPQTPQMDQYLTADGSTMNHSGEINLDESSDEDSGLFASLQQAH